VVTNTDAEPNAVDDRYAPAWHSAAPPKLFYSGDSSDDAIGCVALCVWWRSE
jgi:hypothetical protein